MSRIKINKYNLKVGYKPLTNSVCALELSEERVILSALRREFLKHFSSQMPWAAFCQHISVKRVPFSSQLFYSCTNDAVGTYGRRCASARGITSGESSLGTAKAVPRAVSVCPSRRGRPAFHKQAAHLRSHVLPLLTLVLSAFCLQWLRNPGPQHEKRTLFGDMVCFLFITPLATISGWLCLRGAVDHLHFSSRLEAVGLIALTVALFTIYLFWTLVSFRYHCRLYNEWRRTNQRVILLIPKSANVPSNQQSLLGLPSVKRNSKETIV
uniref:RING-type E3 ubiquitin transferase n=3 Tax=Anseriformes TaxID=8826 RepID=A0A8B9IHT3_ANSCY